MVPHKFYVAVFNLEYVPQKKVVQMTSRVFVDDLEAALVKKFKKKFYLGTSRELPESKDYIKNYFTEKVHVRLNNTARAITFLGKETEDDMLICYFTIPAETPFSSLQMKNTVLFEIFDEQQNIIHASVNRNKKSLLLTNDKTEGTLDYKLQ